MIELLLSSRYVLADLSVAFTKSSCLLRSSMISIHSLVHYLLLQMHPIPLLVAAILFLVFVVHSLLNRRTSAKPRDDELPGPTLIPLIGRIHDLPIQYMWLKFKEWADIYGPIYKTEMLGAKFIIVSDEVIAEELLVKRAKIYSDRPMVRSLFDSKSTHGSMEYLPLMGKNRESPPPFPLLSLLRRPCHLLT
jgi:hypothetical protein